MALVHCLLYCTIANYLKPIGKVSPTTTKPWAIIKEEPTLINYYVCESDYYETLSSGVGFLVIRTLNVGPTIIN